jgi:hypothetical protein
MQQHLDGCGQLAVQRSTIETAESAQCLEAGRNFGGIVGMYRAGAAVVPGVQRRQQIDDLGAANLADHDAIRPHPQRLPHQLAHRDFADPFDVGASCDQFDQMRMPGRQFGGIFDADDALVGCHRTEQRRQQCGFPGAGAAGHQEGQPGSYQLGE